MKVSTKLDETRDLKYPYREAIGSLIYLMLCNKADISNALGCVTKYRDNYDQSQLKPIIRYLNTTKNYRLTYGIGMKNCFTNKKHIDIKHPLLREPIESKE
jgi:hypothetical protein